MQICVLSTACDSCIVLHRTWAVLPAAMLTESWTHGRGDQTSWVT